jgi:hypothetical protein
MPRWMYRLGLLGCIVFSAVSTAQAADATKVLYFTHEPGRWHKYTPQMEIFKKLGADAGWKVTVMTGSHDDQIKKLRTPDFGKGYDAIVYNFCFAKSSDMAAAANLMKQTREHGVPAMLIHCSMHSWWPSYKSGQPGSLGPKYDGKAKADQKLVEQWRVDNPGKPFPAWGDFTGVASGRHGPKKPIKTVKVKDHPATSRLPEGFTTSNTELYNNIYLVDGVVPLIQGEQGSAKAIVMWTCPQGKSQVMGLTIGHGVDDWKAGPIQHLIVDGVNYLAKNPKP